MFSITYLRNENGVYGAKCSCGWQHIEQQSNKPFRNAGNSLRIDTAINNHERKHKLGAANE